MLNNMTRTIASDRVLFFKFAIVSFSFQMRKIKIHGSRADLARALVPLLCVPGFPAGLPFQ